MKYLVKQTSIATQSNPNFAGEMSITYYGKGEKMVKREGTHIPCENFDRTDYMLNEYGYNRLCDAKRAYAYKHPDNTEYWTSTVEIVEIEETPHIILTGHNFVY